MLNEKQIINEIQKSFIRSAIYTLPKKWKIIGLILIVGGTYVFNHFAH